MIGCPENQVDLKTILSLPKVSKNLWKNTCGLQADWRIAQELLREASQAAIRKKIWNQLQILHFVLPQADMTSLWDGSLAPMHGALAEGGFNTHLETTQGWFDFRVGLW